MTLSKDFLVLKINSDRKFLKIEIGGKQWRIWWVFQTCYHNICGEYFWAAHSVRWGHRLYRKLWSSSGLMIEYSEVAGPVSVLSDVAAGTLLDLWCWEDKSWYAIWWRIIISVSCLPIAILNLISSNSREYKHCWQKTEEHQKGLYMLQWQFLAVSLCYYQRYHFNGIQIWQN